MLLKKAILALFLAAYILDGAAADEVVNLIKSKNFPAELHHVTTKDGYILAVHRIPLRQASSKNRGVMFVMHGLFASSPSFLNYGRSSAGFFFSEAGYDVWLGNARGNPYSRNHSTLDPNGEEFWKFSWHEIGIYDLSAMIDYVLHTTNQSQLMYIGHSQGVTSVLVLLSSISEYNDKIKIVHAMTLPVIFKYKPPAYPAGSMMKINELEGWMIDTKNQEINSAGQRVASKFMARMCMGPMYNTVCKYVLTHIVGPSPYYYDRLLYDNMNYFPTSSGYRQVIHYGQLALSGKFQKYDHGPEKNIELYGNKTPPEYDLSKITAKIHIMYGTNDWLCPATNVPLLVEKLKTSVIATSKFQDFNHLDFIYGKQILTIQQKISQIIRKSQQLSTTRI